MAFSTMEEEAARRAREARKMLDDQVQRLEVAGVGFEEAHLRVRGVTEEIVSLAEGLDAGIVVMGALMGSLCDSILCHSHCSVLMVRK